MFASVGAVLPLILDKSQLHLSAYDTPSVMPDLAVPMSSKDFFQGRDPVLDTILNGASAASSSSDFMLYQSGGLSQATANQSPDAVAGYGTLDSQIEAPPPAGLAIFTTRKGDMPVSEATVPASSASVGGRIYVELQEPVRTGGLPSLTQSGSVWITPTEGNSAPSALGVFTFSDAGRVISTAGVPALVPRSSFRPYAEASGDILGNGSGSTLTGVAISFVNQSGNAWSLQLR